MDEETQQKLPWHWLKWFGYLVGLIVFVLGVVGYTRNVKALRNQVISDAAVIDTLNKKLDLETQAEQTQADFAARCVHDLSVRPAVEYPAPNAPDSDIVTVIVSQANFNDASPQPAQSPLVGLANMYRPGLGVIIGALLAPQPVGQAPPATSTIRWVVAGRVTPYITPGDSALVEYAWVNVRTDAVEVRQPDPAGELIARYQQGARP